MKWKHGPLRERFFATLAKGEPDECWLWPGSRFQDGYGSIHSGGKIGKPLLAHRVSWEAHNSDPPGTLLVCHKCDVKLCVNPSHLFLGTHLDNNSDRARKNRSARGERSPKTTLTEGEVKILRAEHAIGGTTYAALGRKFSVTEVTARNIVIRKTWSHI